MLLLEKEIEVFGQEDVESEWVRIESGWVAGDIWAIWCILAVWDNEIQDSAQTGIEELKFVEMLESISNEE